MRGLLTIFLLTNLYRSNIESRFSIFDQTLNASLNRNNLNIHTMDIHLEPFILN
jgi:hypothetical protein